MDADAIQPATGQVELYPHFADFEERRVKDVDFGVADLVIVVVIGTRRYFGGIGHISTICLLDHPGTQYAPFATWQGHFGFAEGVVFVVGLSASLRMSWSDNLSVVRKFV